MQKTLKKTVSLLLSLAFLLWAPVVVLAAVDCDEDKDGYIVISETDIATIDETLPYDANGNYGALELEGYFKKYQDAVKAGTYFDTEDICENLLFKKGAEPERCDATIISPESGVYDTSKVSSLAGAKVNPAAFDVPDNGIDENCDGADGEFVSGSGAEGDLGELIQKAIHGLSKIVIIVSIVITIIGGLMYATAAGDEQKTARAKKAIIGAVIGLIVGLLAPTLVDYIVASLV